MQLYGSSLLLLIFREGPPTTKGIDGVEYFAGLRSGYSHRGPVSLHGQHCYLRYPWGGSAYPAASKNQCNWAQWYA